MAKNLIDTDTSESEDQGVSIPSGKNLIINEPYAKRFAYNKKREELRQRKPLLPSVCV